MGYAGHDRQEIRVGFSRIRLAGNGNAFGKVEVGGDKLFKLLDLVFVALEQIHKTCLRAGCSLLSQHFEVGQLKLEILHVHNKLVDPQRRALANRGKLSGLQMRVRQAGHTLVFLGKRGKVGYYLGKLA